MKLPGGIRIHIFLLVLLSIVTAVFRLSLLSRHRIELRRIAEEAIIRRSTDIEAKWRKHNYVETTSPHFENDFIARIDWAKLQLTKQQSSQLRSRLVDVLQYLRKPTFEDYFRLKTEGLHYQFELSTNTYAFLRFIGLQDRIRETNDIRGMAKFVWNAKLGSSNNLGGITAVSLDEIATTTVRTNSPRILLSSEVRKGYTKAIEALNPGFCYADEGDGSPPNPQKAFFYISFFAQGGSPENSGPVYIGLSWLEADQNWALKYLISDEWVAFRTLF